MKLSAIGVKIRIFVSIVNLLILNKIYFYSTEIVNRVFTTSTDDELGKFERDYKRPAMVRVRLRGVNVMLFESGKIVCNGVRKKNTVKRVLSELFCSVGEITQKSQTATFKINHFINLINVYNATKLNSFYNSEIFPALTLKRFGKTFNIFTSGKVVMLGKGNSHIAYNDFKKWFIENANDKHFTIVRRTQYVTSIASEDGGRSP